MVQQRTSLLALFCLAVLAGTVQAEDFRVETEVFVESNEQPVVTTLTLFRGTTVYDFMGKEAQQITIFDINRGRIILLDSHRKVKTTVTTDQLLRFTASLKANARGSTVDLVTPEMKESYDKQAGTLEMVSKRLKYRVNAIQPPSKEIAERYRIFADWFARLNSMHVGNLPPFARLQLNAALANHGLIPQSVERTVSPANRVGSSQHVRSSHLINWQLTNTDRKRISRAGDYMAKFSSVSPASYWKQSKPADD